MRMKKQKHIEKKVHTTLSLFFVLSPPLSLACALLLLHSLTAALSYCLRSLTAAWHCSALSATDNFGYFEMCVVTSGQTWVAHGGSRSGSPQCGGGRGVGRCGRAWWVGSVRLKRFKALQHSQLRVFTVPSSLAP